MKKIISKSSLLAFLLLILSTTLLSQSKEVKPKVTFIELGSVNCIPCKMMQPVMKNIEKKYGEQIRVIFYDVWTKEQRPYAEKYGIKLIPTQVFLDENGKEFHRHEGFYPEAEIDKVLQSKGLKPKKW
ncbi:thioredoxin family protein [Melioribacteraceae bacterium 4301-Me]|uniref:thioredoxin family protein n=1 Tax=Pyranulibacter aquaticus TaxID=3163344 RepID=UPI003598CAF8